MEFKPTKIGKRILEDCPYSACEGKRLVEESWLLKEYIKFKLGLDSSFTQQKCIELDQALKSSRNGQNSQEKDLTTSGD